MDYLRRLSWELRDRQTALQWEGKKITAIGVLGSDVYDKLLVLKALRRDFPQATFFTNNLDARLGHPDEQDACRNLIVVSPFGLTLDRRSQGHVAPFRDSYQTAMFAATLQVFEDEVRLPSSRPHVYEIGSSGPYELRPPPLETERCRKCGKRARITVNAADEAPAEGPSTAKSDLRPRWLTPWRGFIIALIALCVMALGGWSVNVCRGRLPSAPQGQHDPLGSFARLKRFPFLFFFLAFGGSWLFYVLPGSSQSGAVSVVQRHKHLANGSTASDRRDYGGILHPGVIGFLLYESAGTTALMIYGLVTGFAI